MTSISCVTKIIVNPNFLFISFNNDRICFVVIGSRALVASSQSNTLGLLANALAIPTRCFCPPDS